MSFGNGPGNRSTAFSKVPFTASAAKSGRVQCEVSVAAESVISFPDLVIVPRNFFLKIWLCDMMEVIRRWRSEIEKEGTRVAEPDHVVKV